jgi:hypothetical protein
VLLKEKRERSEKEDNSSNINSTFNIIALGTKKSAVSNRGRYRRDMNIIHVLI